jgi:hypothetical protein
LSPSVLWTAGFTIGAKNQALTLSMFIRLACITGGQQIACQ